MKIPYFFKSPHELANMPPDSPVLLGLSGGADSVTLLSLLCLQREKHYFPLYAAHVNHGIRTENYDNEADRDELFCKQLCKNLDVELFVLHANVPFSAKETKNSIETEARNLRYDFFDKCMKEHHIRILATAHNSDDNLETQIFNLSRGCGIDGICGIKPYRVLDSFSDHVVVRPILRGGKKDILQFCSDNKLNFVTDSTNLDNECTRNRIRHIVIPELENLFGSPQNASSRLSESLLETIDFLNRNSQMFINQNAVFSENMVSFPLNKFCCLDDVIKKRVLSQIFLTVSRISPEKVHVDAMMNILKEKKYTASVALPCDFQAFCDSDFFIICKDTEFKSRQEHLALKFDEVKLKMGWNEIPLSNFLIYIGNAPVYSHKNACTVYDCAALKKDSLSYLTARPRKDGDRIFCCGMRKKIKKLMCDNKIPICERDNLPLICMNGEIVYVPGCAVGDKVKSKDSENICITIYKRDLLE